MTIAIQLSEIECGACGIWFAIPQSYHAKMKSEGTSIHCPNGHSISYSDYESKRLEKQLSAALMREQSEREQRAAAEAEVQKLKKRASNGTCPCCKRSFSKLQQHMKTKHPNFAKP